MESAIAALPALVSRNKDKRTRARVPATINRDIVPLRAALSKLLAPGAPNSNAAWQEALKPIRMPTGSGRAIPTLASAASFWRWSSRKPRLS